MIVYFEKKGGGLKIIVYYPQSPEGQANLNALVGKIHAEYVAQYVEKLNCSTAQKLRLLDAIAQTVIEEAQTEKDGK